MNSGMNQSSQSVQVCTRGMWTHGPSWNIIRSQMLSIRSQMALDIQVCTRGMWTHGPSWNIFRSQMLSIRSQMALDIQVLTNEIKMGIDECV